MLRLFFAASLAIISSGVFAESVTQKYLGKELFTKGYPSDLRVELNVDRNSAGAAKVQLKQDGDVIKMLCNSSFKLPADSNLSYGDLLWVCDESKLGMPMRGDFILVVYEHLYEGKTEVRYNLAGKRDGKFQLFQNGPLYLQP